MARSRSLALVALGGTLGVAARQGLSLLMAPHPGMDDAGSPAWAVIAANIVGALLLGLLYGALDHRRLVHHSTRLGQGLRLLLGIGFCGGFTTYSTFAVGLVLLDGSAGPGQAALFGLGTVAAGALAAWTGLLLGGGPLRRRVAGGKA